MRGLPNAVSPCWKSNGYCRCETVAGSKLSIVRKVIVPFPSLRCAMGIIQLVEKSLSRPRGPVCCVSLRKATPWNISIQSRFIVMIMSFGVELGSASVPAVA